ncbi:MAG TPA: histidine--tRNA ligase [Clostridiales bacterium]|nr:histidine--tRNA ligase [Clostridiales bacterium]HQK73375.1 histidine--tRNA ligase [Clostridiales bacterium]
MALITPAVKGTKDILPSRSGAVRFLETLLLELAAGFGFKEIRTPVFEYTELFTRGVGETTDVVTKEMYTFDDKGGRSLTLKPEGTAGAVRAFLEHGLFNETLPQKVSYVTSCYRYEKPQAGRYREFNQFGVECLGAAAPAADAEMISLAQSVFDFLGISRIRLELNSIGCPSCRKQYTAALLAYFGSKTSELCSSCGERLGKNPMRILDCKSPVCSAVALQAPVMLDYLCGECREHFEGVRRYLEAMDIAYTVNPRIVRGLDYYTRTVFEFVSGEIGAQGTVCGGGRYDGLVEELGGPSMPSLGFAMGLERLMLVLDKQNIRLPSPGGCAVYIASVGGEASLKAAQTAYSLRAQGIAAEFDLAGRSLKAQMKYAGKIGAAYTAVIGEEELKTGSAALKRMADGFEIPVALGDFAQKLSLLLADDALSGAAQAVAAFGPGQGDPRVIFKAFSGEETH